MRKSYEHHAQLSAYYFEDSFVLAITESQGRFEFEIEAVLTPEHKDYKNPKPSEQHCYKNIKLIFDEIERFTWEQTSFKGYRDASGEVDYGSIDVFTFDGDSYELEGDWGKLKITARKLWAEEKEQN
ncbi:MAG: hypothetical protein KJ017_05950 [Alphaproteobacteria bacterium]|nr:hypothetical protein [Alphaproteobacteria bacterium]